MNILVFLLTKKLKNFYSISNWKGLLNVLFFAAILMVYAIGTSFIYDRCITKGLTTSANNIITGVKVMLIVLPSTLKFFPSFSFKKTIIRPHYPISKFKIALIDFIAMCFIKASNWILFAFVIVLYIASSYMQSNDLILMFYYWLAGFLLAENIINAVSWRKYVYLIMCLLLLISLIIFTTCHYQTHLNQIENCTILTIYVVLLLVSFFLLYKNNFEVEYTFNNATFGRQAAKGTKYVFLQLLWRNQTCRTALLIAFGCKIGFLILFLSSTEHYTLSQLLQKVPFVLLLEPPIIVFTYVFNNIWGYFVDIQLNNIIINPTLKTQAKTYLNILSPVLLIDFALVIAIWAYFGVLNFKIILIYIVFSTYCLPIGFLSSFRKYFLVDLSMSFSGFRGKTSQFYSFTMIIPAFIVGFIYDYDIYLYIFLGTLSLISFATVLFIKSTFRVHYLLLKKHFFA